MAIVIFLCLVLVFRLEIQFSRCDNITTPKQIPVLVLDQNKTCFVFSINASDQT